MAKRKKKQAFGPKLNWICYLDLEKDKIGAIEDDHIGVDDMVKNKPGWKHLGYYYGTFHSALKYASEVFVS
jgi:hypothetical protein